MRVWPYRCPCLGVDQDVPTIENAPEGLGYDYRAPQSYKYVKEISLVRLGKLGNGKTASPFLNTDTEMANHG